MRKREDYEKNIDLRCLVEFKLSEGSLGAYLLEKKNRYCLRFGFSTPGLGWESRDFSLIIDQLGLGMRGIHSLKGSEVIRIHQRSVVKKSAKIKSLETIASTTDSLSLSFLASSQQSHLEQLTANKERIDYVTDIWVTYGNELVFSENFLENVLFQLHKGYKEIKGTYKKEIKQQLLPFLTDGLEVFRQWSQLLSQRWHLKIEAKNVAEVWSDAWYEFNEGPPEREVHKLIVTEELVEKKISEETNKLAIKSLLIRGNKGTASIPIKSYSWIKIKSKYVGAVVVEKRIEGYNSYQQQLAFWWDVIRKIPDCELVWELFSSNTKADKVNLVRNIRTSKSSIKTGEKYGGGQTAVNNLEILDSEETLEKLAVGKKTLKMSAVFFLTRSSVKELKNDCHKLVGELPLDLAIIEEDDVHSLWRNKHPFNWQPLLQTWQREPYVEDQISPPVMMAQQFESGRGVELLEYSSGSPVTINWLDNHHNMLFLAQKRKGKTAFATDKIITNLIYSIPSTFLDYGMSDARTTCSDLVDFLGKKWAANVELGRTQCNLLQIENLPKLSPQSSRLRNYQNCLLNFLEEVVLESEKTGKFAKNTRDLLNFAVPSFFASQLIKNRYERATITGQWPTAIDLTNYLKGIDRDNSDFMVDSTVLKEVVNRLNLFFHSPLGQSFCQPRSLNLDVKFLNFSLRGARNESESALCAMAAQILALTLTMKYSKVEILIDEGSLLLKQPTLATTTGENVVNGAKSGIAVSIFSQDSGAITSSVIADQLRANLDLKLVGAIADSDVETVAEFLRIDPELLAINASKNFLPSPQLLATHWQLFAPSTSMHLLHRPPPHWLALIASNPVEQLARKRYFETYLDPIEALIEFGNDYRKAKRNGIEISSLRPQSQISLEKMAYAS